jgi:capsular polysaccharide biosynthesis protein
VGRMDVSRNRLEGSNRQLVNEGELATRLHQEEGFTVVEASVRCAHKRNVFH